MRNPSRASSTCESVHAGVDLHSYSEPTKIWVKHVHLELRTIFEKRILEGIATLHIERGNRYPTADLILDTRNLNVHKVETSSRSAVYKQTRYELGQADAILGTPLTIELPADASVVRITYSTNRDATALQWLDPVQTKGKRFPFLFTQSQAIHARSWIPLQDTPAVRVTYSADVQVPDGLLAVMSGENDPAAARDGRYGFHMKQPIPSYLIALAVGDLSFAATSNRTGVYAERPIIERARNEFQEAEKMLEAAEQLYGPYQWGRFDTMVLPPRFPYGGMENPGVIFVTPTLVVGDRSAVS